MKYYDQLVEQMTNFYIGQTKLTPDRASDVMIRIRVLAAQLDSYCQDAEEVAIQSSPFTATGEALDRHAALRGLVRKEGTRATGVAFFERNSPAGYNITIPAGTVIQTSGAEPLRFVTRSDIILPGAMTVMLGEIEAVEPGAKYNVKSGMVNVMVTPPPGITEVYNGSNCIGGTDPESDEALRARLLDACRNPVIGMNPGFYRGLMLAQAGVGKVKVISTCRGSGTVDLVVYGKGTTLAASKIAALQALLQDQRDLGIDVLVRQAVTTQVNLKVELTAAPGWEHAEVAERCKETIQNEMAGLDIGKPWLLARMNRLLMEQPGVYNCKVMLPTADTFPLEDRLLVPGGITIDKLEVQV